MVFHVAPELFTGLSDVLNFFVTLVFWLWLRRCQESSAKPWRYAMLALTASNLIGGIVHTFALPQAVDDAVWIVLPLIMCVTVFFFAICGVQELEQPNLRAAHLIFGIGGCLSYLGMMILSAFTSDFLIIYVIYAAICLIFAMVCFAIAAVRRARLHLLWYVAGIVIQIPGGVLQAQRKFYFTLIWEMDFNTAYHLITTATVILFMIGYVRGRKAVKV